MDQLFHNCFFCYFSTGAQELLIILGCSSHVSALLYPLYYHHCPLLHICKLSWWFYSYTCLVYYGNIQYLSYAHIPMLNMRAQCGTLIWLKREPFWRECKSCCNSWNMDYESMLGHLNIPTLQQRRLQLKASMMCQFVHGESYIPEDIHREKMPNTTVVYFTKML